MIQLESSNKDLERKNTVLADTIKIYESDQNNILRQKYFSDQASHDASAHTSSASAPPISAGAAHYSPSSCHNLKTLDRLINYLLDVVQQIPKSQVDSSTRTSIPSSAKSSVPPNSSASTSSQEMMHFSGTEDLSCPPEQQPETLPDQTAVLTSPQLSSTASPPVILSEINTIEGETNEQLVYDIEDFQFGNDEVTEVTVAADNTIDEFMDLGDTDAPPVQHQPLNCQPLTIQ